jgi:hypothetical protein
MMLIGVSCGWLTWFIFSHTYVKALDVSRLAFGITVGVLCGVGSLVIMLFLSMHLVMAAKGMTTLEVFEKSSAEGFEDDSCIKTICCTQRDPETKEPLYPPSRYRLPRLISNFKAALGEDIAYWLIPTHPKMKTGSYDGLSFETNMTSKRSEVDDSADSPLINPDQR